MNENVGIKIEELTKIYKDFERKQETTAINNLNIEIYKGEILGIYGVDGSGKTTLARIISGQDIPTNGTVTISEKSPTDPKVKSKIGILPEKSFAIRFSNAEEAMNFLGRSSSIPRERRKRWIRQLFTMTGLSKVRKSPIKGFSEIMLRKLNLALTLINNPDFVVLDEPLQGLEPEGVKDIKDVIKALKEQGKAIIIFTGTVEDVEDICDRTIQLEKVELQPVAPTQQAPEAKRTEEAPAASRVKPLPHEELDEEEMTRRKFFTIVESTLFGIISTCIAVPLVVYAIAPTLRREAAQWADIGDITAFTPGKPFKTTVTVIARDGWTMVKKSKNIFIIKNENGQFTVFSDMCTHLGCAVKWVDDKKQFLCPCHNAIFDADGNVVAGPPPEPLIKLDYKISEGNLLVSIV